MFFLCTVEDMSHFSAMDDVADSFFLPLSEINPEDFGLDSIRRGLKKFLSADNSLKYNKLQKHFPFHSVLYFNEL